MQAEYAHIASKEHLELKESFRPPGAAPPLERGQTEDELLDMVRACTYRTFSQSA